MKIKQLFLFAIALVMLSLLLTACEIPFDLPFDIPFLGGEATTEAVTTTDPVTTTTTGAGVIITLPPVTAAQNSITEVKTLNSKNVKGLRLTFKDKSSIMLEPSLGVGDGYNSVTYTYSFDKESGVLTLTLYDGAYENIALSHLGLDRPAPLTVKIREYNKNLEWAYEGSDTWAVLCKTNEKNATPLATLRKATGFATNKAPTDTGVTFVISGDNLRFRAHAWQREGYDYCTDAYLHGPKNTTNENFLMRAIYEIPSSIALDSLTTNAAKDGVTKFKSSDDEIPAISINGTYIAALHGYYLISRVPNMGLGEADIGQVFTRKSDGQQYVLVKVPDAYAWFCPFDEAAMESGDFTEYGYPMKGALKTGDELTYTVNNRQKSVSVTADATHEQFRSSTNHVIQHAYLNGTVEVDLTKDGVYTADYVDFYERYDVLYLPSVLGYLMDNVGNNTNASCHDDKIEESYLSYIQTHRFHKNGSFTVYQTVTFNTHVDKVAYFGVMSQSFSSTSQIVYAPGAENCGTPTVHTPEEHQQATGSKYFYAQGDATVRSFYHFPDNTFYKGMNVGYYPYFGIATDEIRTEQVALFGSVGEWSHMGKLYPHLYKASSAEAGDAISFIGYHSPVTRFDDDFFAINWYFVGDEIYLSMHTDKAVAEKTVAIPNADYLTGLAITVDDASEGFTVVSDTVTADGITVSTTGAGYVTLKLTK